MLHITPTAPVSTASHDRKIPRDSNSSNIHDVRADLSALCCLAFATLHLGLSFLNLYDADCVTQYLVESGATTIHD